MTKKRKRSTALDDLPWKTVETAELPEPSDALNHYDDSLQTRNELEATPGESVAMFFGLQVISGDDYTVNQHGKLEPVDKKKVKDKKRAPEASLERQESSVTVSAKKPKSAVAAVEVEPTAESNKKDETSEGESAKSKRRKRKKKRKKKAAPETPEEADEKTSDGATSTTDSSEMERMQTAWMVATGGVTLHPTLCTSLLKQQFWTPTPIQSATLPAAILGRRNIVGAAPTGSGKTLAYLLPILQSLLSQENGTRRVLQALVLTPTRELALQVSRECDLLAGEKRLCATIVGGLALAKQQRVLEKNKPPILVATPGRLWELVSSDSVASAVHVWSRKKEYRVQNEST